MNIEEGNPQGISEESNVPDIGTETAGTDPGAAEREEVQKAGQKKTGEKTVMKRLKERARRRKRLILRQIELKRLKTGKKKDRTGIYSLQVLRDGTERNVLPPLRTVCAGCGAAFLEIHHAVF